MKSYFQVDKFDLLVSGKEGLGPLLVIEETESRVSLEVPGQTLHWVVHKSRGKFVDKQD